jgi:RND family efflux transporter MFP subunit
MFGLLRKKWFWGALLFGVAACGALWLHLYARQAKIMADPAAARHHSEPTPVRTAQVVEEETEQVIGGPATTAASDTAVLELAGGGPSSLIVKAVHFRDGAYVERGKVVIEFEDELFIQSVKHREAAVAAAQAELELAKVAVVQKANTYKQNLAYAQAEVKRAEAMIALKDKSYKQNLVYAQAEVEHADKAAELRANSYKQNLAYAQAEVKRARQALAEKVKSYRQAVVYAEAAFKHAQETVKVNVTLRKLGLDIAEAEVQFQKSELQTRKEHLTEAEERYKKADKTVQAVSIYYEARYKLDRANIELGKAERAQYQAKKDAEVGPLFDKEALEKAKKTLEHARTEAIVDPLGDQEALEKAQKVLEKARIDVEVGPLADREAQEKARKALVQARTDAEVGPLLNQEALAKTQRALENAKSESILGPLHDQESLSKAQSALAVARVHLAQAQKEAEECLVKAPLDGLVDSLTLVPGQKVKAYSSLAHLLKIDPILVKMDFPQERLGDIAPGQAAEVVLDSFPGETFPGKVVRILPKVDSHARVLPVFIQVDNAKHRLRPGVTGFARIRSSKRAVLAPAAAVISRGNRAMVFRVEGGRAQVCEVRPGAALKTGMVEICSTQDGRGLKPGDEVVIYTNFYGDSGYLVRDDAVLQDGDPVDTNWRRWARRND